MRSRHALLVIAAGLLILSPLAMPAPARAEYLGDGVYMITATEFGFVGDGAAAAGGSTSAGTPLYGDDHLVALPACTESSCPDLPLGTDTSSPYGPQTPCADASGLCWVSITDPDTGRCAIAPVLDVGPLFVEDNWWAPWYDRTYSQDQGIPEAEPAEAGGDVGFGPGISDVGYNVAADWAPAGIDLAEGTWNQLRLDPAAGSARLQVTLLWQAGIAPEDACGFGWTETNDSVNFRAGPSTNDDIYYELSAWTTVIITGSSENGFLPVMVDGQFGWVYMEYLDL
jgi:SH3 domain-containing protein